MEEKGLLRRRSSSPASNGYDRKGKGKEREVRLEKATFVEEQHEGEGLTSRKDKEAFALLVVLCQSSSLNLSCSC